MASGITISCDGERDSNIFVVSRSNTARFAEVARDVFGRLPVVGEMQSNGSLQLLRTGPDTSLLLSSEAALPAELDRFSDLLTDVTHAYRRLSITGRTALDFMNAHVPVQMDQHRTDHHRMARSVVNTCAVTVHWNSRNAVQLLCERSYGEWLLDYLRQLAQRWQPAPEAVRLPLDEQSPRQ